MTGKDLILFIINHDLLDVDMASHIKCSFSDLFLTVEEAAVKLGISTTSLLDMIRLGIIDYVAFDDVIYLHKDVTLTSIKRR